MEARGDEMEARALPDVDFPDGIFPVEEALEIILLFDRMGKICYANGAARRKLKYADDICGRHIGDVFPGTFRQAKDSAGIEDVALDEMQNLVAYRSNTTCFPVEGRVIRSSK